ncbi:hypothetical protein BTR23_04180 [Alkalihalophilus pseudofirmus]|nr:hypothetical protein BTR23_04180 [Alkalihalophilus pseudofirmus]
MGVSCNSCGGMYLKCKCKIEEPVEVFGGPVEVTGGSVTDPLIVDSALTQANLEGKMYIVNTDTQLLSGTNDNLSLILTNPMNSGVIAISDFVSVTALDTNFSVGIRRNPVYSGGTTTTLTPRNLNTAFPDNAQITAVRQQGNTTVTSGDLLSRLLIQQGGEAIFPFSGRLVLTPGNSISITGNVFAGNRSVAVGTSWIEIPL